MQACTFTFSSYLSNLYTVLCIAPLTSPSDESSYVNARNSMFCLICHPNYAAELHVIWVSIYGPFSSTLQYDLTKMQILSRKGGSLSRVFNPGVWVWASSTEQQYSLNVKLGRLQVGTSMYVKCAYPVGICTLSIISHANLQSSSFIYNYCSVNNALLLPHIIKIHLVFRTAGQPASRLCSSK